MWLLLSTVLSFDAALSNQCVQVLRMDYGAAFRSAIPPSCEVSSGNTVQAVAHALWSPAAGWEADAGSYPEDSYFLAYLPGEFVYAGARDSNSTSLLRNVAIGQRASPNDANGIPLDLMLSDSRYPLGYVWRVQFAVAQLSSVGLTRVTMVYHLVGNGNHYFLEFDVMDNDNIPVCEDANGRKWVVYCPSSESSVIASWRHWGDNAPTGVWTTREVHSGEVIAALAAARPDLDPRELSIRQVYIAMELQAGYGHLQVKTMELVGLN